MLEQNGEIRKNAKGEYFVHVERTSACKHCGACKGREEDFKLDGECPLGAAHVEMPSGRVLLASMIAYIIPLLFFVVGLFAGYPLGAALALPGNADLWAGLFGLILLAVSYLAIRLLTPWFKRRGIFSPRITMVEPKESE